MDATDLFLCLLARKARWGVWIPTAAGPNSQTPIVSGSRLLATGLTGSHPAPPPSLSPPGVRGSGRRPRLGRDQNSVHNRSPGFTAPIRK